MALARINWGAIGTFLFVIFVLGVIAFEQMEPAPAATADETTSINADVSTVD
ncbi:MAG: hypothetical protein AB8G99_10260 [Planctomycetaceae bacterium]